MGLGRPPSKCILAALAAAVWYSAPTFAQAQEEAPALAPEASDAAPEEAAEEAPRPTRAERESDLLEQLAAAPDPHAAALIETELKGLWSRSGSAAVDLLVKRGQDALEAGLPEEAIEHFTAAIDWAPSFAEAYVGRASAYYLTGRAGPALDDLREALVLNPHQWEALGGFAVMLEELGREEDALELWRRVTDMHPQNPEAEASAQRLEHLLEGMAL
jgi:tetratricopeptide (TPR) repeat protein